MANQKFITVKVTGEKVLKSGTSVSTGVEAGNIVCLNNDSKLDETLFPDSIGIEAHSYVCTEIIAPNSFVNIYNNAGTTNVRNAIANSVGYEANGYSIEGSASGALCKVFCEGVVPYVGAVVGSAYFLSDTVAGQATTTPPSLSTSGNFIQVLGTCIDAGKIRFEQGADSIVYID